MTQCTADFETGTNGANIATTDTGSQTAWDFVTITTGTVSYSNAHAVDGTLSAVFSANSSQHYLGWTTSRGTITEDYGRAYFYFAANPASIVPLILATSAGAGSLILYLNSAGKLRVDDATGTSATFTNSVILNDWFRVEWHVVCSTTVGQTEIKLFNTANSTTPTETKTSAANRNTQANQDSIGFGPFTGGFSAVQFYMDGVVAGATSYPGPGSPVIQTLLPASDSVDGTWHDDTGGTSIAAAIDETTASDTDFIRSPLGTQTQTTRVKLASGTDPASSTGHIIHWRIRKDAAAGEQIDMTVTLRQGGGDVLGAGTQIAQFSRTNVDGSGWTTYDETLSSGEADSITDYGDLYLELTADTA